MKLALVLLLIALVISIVCNMWMWRINKLARSALAKLTDKIREDYREPVVQQPQRVLIAGNRSQAEFYIHECQMNPRRVIIAETVPRLRGLSNVDIVFCGTWWENRNISAIMEWVSMQRAMGQVLGEFELPEKITRPSSHA